MGKILFDLDDTLIDSERFRESGIDAGVAYLKDCAGKYGIDIRDSHLKEAKSNVYRRYSDSGRRTCKRERFLEVIRIAAENSGIDYKQLGYDLTKMLGNAFEIYQSHLRRSKLYDAAQEMLERLPSAGHFWLIFSNGTSEDVEVKLEASGVPKIKGYEKSYSTDIEDSPRGLVTGIGMNKTPTAFSWFRERFGIEIMVGNDPEEDIKPAEEAGLTAILCQNGDYSELTGLLGLDV
jgi:FMN phosphatase YigB (HAD superfamily)